MDLIDEIQQAIKASCRHICHERGLNPWVRTCPVCGCANPKYDPNAVSDIDMSRLGLDFPGRSKA